MITELAEMHVEEFIKESVEVSIKTNIEVYSNKLVVSKVVVLWHLCYKPNSFISKAKDKINIT